MNKTQLIEQIKAEKEDIAEFSKALKLARAYKKIHQEQLNDIIAKEAEEAEMERNQAILQECFDKEFKQ
jgi:ABC-type nitrate/sulfonate/bicarbonate transport system substrate-binding protein